ncbi:MAG: hypothetical protein MUC47_07685 [Candidatus Kapabacteria bacterium]|nr:hypothetical protein [Candidatus Kapabacteria bacterium]
MTARSALPELLLRYSLATVYLWFGILKLIGASPAHDLVLKTLSWFPEGAVINALGCAEVLLGLGFLIPRWTPVVVVLFFIHMAGTFLPFVNGREFVWSVGVAGLSLTGQYIIKNVVFIAAGAALRQLWLTRVTQPKLRDST